MTHSYRLSADEAPYAVVAHNDKVDLVIDGKQARALRGDTVASAMLASGFKTAANSL